MTELNTISQLIRVQPLRVRPADLRAWLLYQLRLQCSRLGWEETSALLETVVRRLQNHDFPDNLRELESMEGRAGQPILISSVSARVSGQ